MKILNVIPGLAKASGPTTFCVKVCDHIADEQTTVTIVHGDRIDATSLTPKNPLVRLLDWQRVLQNAPPDIIHIHALWSPFSHAGVRYARKHKTPYVISTHGMLAPWALKHKWLKKKLAWWIYQRRDLEGAAMFHVTAECEIKWLRDLGFKQPCVLVPLGSDLPELCPSKTPRPDIKSVLFVGRIYPVKGLINLVRAWAEVRPASLRASTSADTSTVDRSPSQGSSKAGLETGSTFSSSFADATADRKVTADKHWELETRESESHTHALMNSRTNELPRWQLVIAGPDQAGHKSEVVAEAKRLGLRVEDSTTNVLMHSRTNGLPPDLVFTGPVFGKDKENLYAKADLFVLPSYSENFGAVVIEALAYGCPVITTKGTPWSELLGNSDSSLVHCCDSALVERPTSFAKATMAQEVGGQRSSLCPTNALMNYRNNALLPNGLMNSRTNELTRTGRAGWWIDIGVEPLEEALKEAMSLRDEERHVMGENGRRLVEAKYMWPTIAANMKQAYGGLLESGL
ncbi:MAG: glycosyltransferase [bacterium]